MSDIQSIGFNNSERAVIRKFPEADNPLEKTGSPSHQSDLFVSSSKNISGNGGCVHSKRGFINCSAHHDHIKENLKIEPPPNIPLLAVPDTRQSVDYSCGASALQAVLMYYGDEYMESTLMEMLKTTKNGTNPRDIVQVADELGYNVSLREKLTIDDLQVSVKEGVPVIVSGQAWRDGEDLNKPWKDVWDSGHYMVVIGVDEKNVYFEDPSLLGSRGVIQREEFMERWHDLDEKKYHQMGIFIKGRKPLPPPAFIHID